MVYQILITRTRGFETAVELTEEISNISISRASGNKNSVATINFINPNKSLIDTSSDEVKQFNEFIQFDDIIKIVVSRTSINPNSIDTEDILFVGLVTGLSGSMDGSSFGMSVSCVDLTDYLLSKVTSANYNGVTSLDTSSEIIENLVQQCNDNHDFSTMIKTPNATTAGGGGRPVGGDIETTTNTITFSSSYRTVAELIKELSIPTYTAGARMATYYIDEERNFFWWIPKNKGSTTITSTITSTDLTIPVGDVTIFTDGGGVATIGGELLRYSSLSGSNLIVSDTKERGIAGTKAAAHTSGDSIENTLKFVVPYSGSGAGKILSGSFSTSTDDVVNMLIIRMGVDKKQQPIVWYAYNPNTTTSKIRMKILDRPDFGQNYYANLIAQGGGNALVETAFDSSDTTITLNSAASGFPASGGFIKISSVDNYEIIEYTTMTANAPNYDFTGLTRGSLNTAVLENVEVETIAQDYSDIGSMSNDTIRAEIKQEGVNFGQSFFSTNREKLKFRLSIEGSKIQPGEFAELTIQDLGINKALARISDVQHTIDGKSWTTELTMEEDDTEIN